MHYDEKDGMSLVKSTTEAVEKESAARSIPEFWAENEQIGCACRVPDSAGRATRRFATADSLLRHPTVITALGLPH